MNDAQCGICPHICRIREGERGFCLARKNIGGKIVNEAYGKITALALDPIEKKPLKMFESGKMILSVGSYGCNLRCPFCQNHGIALPAAACEVSVQNITPDELVKLALDTVPQKNIGVAYTYNEPLINFEFLRDTARLISASGLKNVLVTNGYINPAPLKEIIRDFHAMNIDLKGFSQDFYGKIGGNLEIVKNNIKTALKYCHVEVTTLVIPDENERDIEPIAKWLASLDENIPFHISRFFPQNLYSSRLTTPKATILQLAELAKKYLKNVFTGNI